MPVTVPEPDFRGIIPSSEAGQDFDENSGGGAGFWESWQAETATDPPS
jgi:hypothetical protein